MDQRLTKQIVIGTVYLVLLLVVGLLLWSIRGPEGTCSDGIKNQNEEDVDCGGSCASCLVIPEDVRLLEVSVLAESGLNTVAFTLENANPQWGLLALPYTVTIVLGEETVVKMQGNAYLLPLERRTFTEQFVLEPGQPSGSTASVTLGEATWVEPPPDVSSIEITLLDPTFIRNPEPNFAAEVRGKA